MTREERWLDELEVILHDCRDHAIEATRNASTILELEEAVDQIGRFIDHESGMIQLARLLPIHHFVRGSPLAKVIQEQAQEMLGRVETAIELQEQLEETVNTVDQLEEMYGKHLPHVLGYHLERAKLDKESLRRVRRIKTIPTLQVRLANIEGIMHRVHSALINDRAVPNHLLHFQTGQDLTAEEQRLLLYSRIADRGESGHRIAESKTRNLVVAHLHRLGHVAHWKAPSMPMHTVAETLAHVALEVSDPPPGDGILWGGLLKAAQQSRYRAEEGVSRSWNPRIEMQRPISQAQDDRIYYVLDLDHGYAFISNQHATPTRLWTWDQPEVGKAFECVAFQPIERKRIVSRGVLRNLGAFFGGLEVDRPGWYRTSVRARVEVIAKAAGGWFATIQRKGKLKRLVDIAELRGHEKASDVRLVPEISSGHPFPIAMDSTDPQSAFFGLKAMAARSECLPDVPLWAKEADTGLEESLDKELTLFTEIARNRADFALVPIGWGAGENVTGAFPCYHKPFGVGFDANPSVASWIAAEKRQTLCSVARILVAIRGLGWSVGLVHRDAFVYGMTSRAGRTLLPSAILVHAPLATSIGERYSHFEAGAVPRPTFPNLAIRWLPKRILNEECADDATDAHCFSIFALDMLARESVKMGRKARLYDGLLAIADGEPDRFDSPDLMLEIMTCIEYPDRLWAMIERLAREA